MHLLVKDIVVDQTANVEALLVSMEKAKTTTGADFTILHLNDGNEKFDARMWSVTPETIGVREGTFVTAEVKAQLYKDQRSYIVNSIIPYMGTDLNIEDYIVTPPYDIDEMYNYILNTLRAEAQKATTVVYSADRNEPISNIAIKLLEDNAEKFKKSVAAVSMHHDIYGGLLYHTYGMMKGAVGLAQAYPNLDRELLLTAVAIHDIGKLYTYTTSDVGAGNVNTLELLDGHLAIGYATVMKESKNHNCPPERVHLLEHMVGAHHGKPEWGAMTKPATPEAFLVFALDYIDSRLYMYNQAQDSINPGEQSEKIFGLDGTRVYRPNYKR